MKINISKNIYKYKIHYYTIRYKIGSHIAYLTLTGGSKRLRDAVRYNSKKDAEISFEELISEVQRILINNNYTITPIYTFIRD